MPNKTVYIENIGPVILRKNKRSKNVSISIKPSKGVSVTIPYFLSYAYGLEVLEKKRDWVEKHLPKIKAYEQKKTVFTEDTVFNTMHRKLRIQSHSLDIVKTKIDEKHIRIYYPEILSVQNQEIQDIIKQAIVKVLRAEAKEFLPDRTLILAQKYGFKYQRIFIKNNKTLWGSCSGRNNINLNLHLVRLPAHLIDYVIIHELCHTVEKNHGPRFWSLMDSILTDSKRLSKELRKFSIDF
jgi:predicted metal-dependent hydrolase